MDYFLIYVLYTGLLFCSIVVVANDVLSSETIFLPQPSSQDATDKRNAVLQCRIKPEYRDEYDISWITGGKPIKKTKRRYQVKTQLIFSPIDRHLDGNKFQCVAKKKNSSEERLSEPVSFNIKWVEAGGVILKRPSNKSEIRTDMIGSIVLNCNITGNPSPNNFLWYVGNMSISDGEDSVRINNQGRLTIKHPKLQVYDGDYWCCASYLSTNMCSPEDGHFTLKVADHKAPQLVRWPTDQVVPRGASVTLDCVFEAQPPPKIVWRRAGFTKELANKSKSGQCDRRCVYPNGTLVIRKFRSNFEGDYECFAKQEGYESQSVSVNLKLAFIQPFSPTHEEKFVSVGRKFEFNCEKPQGNPEPHLMWRRLSDNLEIEEGQSHVSRIKDTLVIDNMAPGDAGTYSCTAVNIAGRETKNVSVMIGSVPHIKRLDNERTKEGLNFTWTCPVEGFPEPSITWYKDQSVIRSTPGRVMINGTRITIYGVRPSDQGSYFCQAQSELDNSDPTRSNSAALSVEERLKFWPPLRDVTVALGEEALVNCSVAGSMDAKVMWERLNGGLGADVTLLNSTNQQSLYFLSPRPYNGGLYQCNASDSGSTISGRVNISVYKRPTIVTPPEEQTVSVGEPVMFDCVATVKQVKPLWSFEGKLSDQPDLNTSPSHADIFDNGSMLISRVELDDMGTYSCTYAWRGLEVRAFAQLTVVEELPEPQTTPADGNSTQMIQTIALSVSGAIAYVLITVALIVYCRRKHRKKNTGPSNEEEEMLKGSSCNGHRRDEVINVKNGIPLQDLSHLSPDLDNLFYPSASIESITVIGRGEYGNVFLSKAPGLFPDLDDDILVMVKAFESRRNGQTGPSSALRSDFNREINLLHMAHHEGVVKLLAVSSNDSGSVPDYLITEYLEWGILKLCLNGTKTQEISKFSKSSKMNMCCQLACALEHLAKLGVTHNDVATRNCVISFQLHVKISFLGLTREGFENEYHYFHGKRLPIRWMAPEALFEGEYSSKSDVWSFAVTCWEVFTLADLPYDGLSDDEFIEAMRSSSPPSLPPLDGSKRITSLIKKCCQRSAPDRPEMKQIMRKLQSIISSEDVFDDKSVDTKGLLT